MATEGKIIQDRFLQKKEAVTRDHLEDVSNKELLGEVVQERIEKGLETLPPLAERESQIITQTIPPPPSPPPEEEDTVGGAKEKEILQTLVGVALQDSIPKAVIDARQGGNAFILDKLHDVLVDEYYEQLKSKGAI